MQSALINTFIVRLLMYSCPDRNGMLSVSSRMNHTRAGLLSIEEDSLYKNFVFEESVKGIESYFRQMGALILLPGCKQL